MERKPSLPLVADAPEPVLIPECWYPIAEAGRLRGDRPLSLERLGRRWVLWRDAEGQAACLPAACPHRGADLGLGRVRDGEIECPYHGFRFSGAGHCTAVPCEGREARIPAGLHLRSKPIIHEAHGLIWMWHGAGEPSQPAPAWIDGAPEPGPRHATWQESWSVCFTRVMEGMQDIHHFPFAHRKLDPWRGQAARVDPYECHVEGERIDQVACMRRDEPGAKVAARFDFSCAFPSVIFVRFGERVAGTVVVCPIDRERTWVWACYQVRTGLGRAIDRLASWLGLWSEFALVQPDDKRMLSSSRPQASTIHDFALVRADAAIAAWHKLRRQRLRAVPGQPRAEPEPEPEPEPKSEPARLVATGS